MTAEEALKDLYDRVASKVPVLTEMACQAEGVAERARLRGKVEGVNLVLSFIHDARRFVASQVLGDTP